MMIETHISKVLLREHDVLKTKKPVDLGFLDFRTIEARKAACEAEVELNRRLAPGVYLGVVPIEENGVTIDWAVHMVRLSDRRRADLRLEKGTLRPIDIDSIAERIARFHEEARCDEHTSSFGEPRAIAINVRENFAQTRGVIERYLSTGQAREIESRQLAVLDERADVFRRRVSEKHVRDGHGDLRLEHVYLDPIVVIDCIEFNERFRFADTCSDIAFLAMDLAAHGRVDFAERLLARYARASNDFDLYSVVDFYEGYRAYVRGKVATMSGPGREDDARHHFRLALATERPSFMPPMVVAVGGIIASGKSTVASSIGDALSAPVVDADRTRKSMLGVHATKRIEEGAWRGAYDPHFTEDVYAEVLRRADVVLASGRPVVLDASFRSPAMRRAARVLAVRHDVPFRLVECHAPVEVCRARLEERARGTSVSDGRLAIFDDFCARFEAMTELRADEHLVLDTTRPLDETMRRVRDRIATWPLGLTG